MRKYKLARNALFIGITGVVTIFSSCTTNYNSITLEGTWQVVDMEADMPTVSPGIISEGEKLALSTTYFFRSDNTCLVTSDYYPDGYEATWQFDEDSMLLRVESADEIIIDNSNFSIEFENAKKIYLSQSISELGDLRMTLTKKRK